MNDEIIDDDNAVIIDSTKINLDCSKEVGELMLTQIKKIESKLEHYVEELPVLGFNSGKYDLNLVKKKIMKHLRMYENQNRKFVVKRNNNYVCISNETLKFLDISNYLAPGCSYNNFLKAYKCSMKKSYFPYEYFTSIDILNNTHLPEYDKFYSSLKNCNVLEEEYNTYNKLLMEGLSQDEALKKMQLDFVPNSGKENYDELCQIWESEKMETFRDFLIYYNNLDTKPFVEGVEKLIAFYHNENVDIFKESITLPGVARKLLYKSVSPSVHFSLFNKNNADLYHTFRANIVGGPSIVFSRYAEANKTKIREHIYKEKSKLCKRVIGFDSNALYLYSMQQCMPCGVMTRRRAEKGFQREVSERYMLAVKWLDFIQESEGISIQHALNSEREYRIPPYYVDGHCSSNNTVYEMNGCYYHNHQDCWITRKIKDPIILQKGKENYERTLTRQKYIESQGYNVITKWECEFREDCSNNEELIEFLERYKRPMDIFARVSEDVILDYILKDKFFGAVELDLEVPLELRSSFRNEPNILYNRYTIREYW